MKETTEFLRAGFATVNAYAEAKKDGEINGNDLQYILPLVFKWQEGIKDLTFSQEAAAGTPDEIENAFKVASSELTSSNMTDDFKYGFTQAAKGYYCTYWSVSRAAFVAGQEALMREIKKHGINHVSARFKAQVA